MSEYAKNVTRNSTMEWKGLICMPSEETRYDGLIAAIDRYLAKADEDYEEQLKSEGFVKTAETIAAMNVIEDASTEALNAYCDVLLEELQNSNNLDNFIDKIWPAIQTADELEKKLKKILHDQFYELLNQCVQQYLVDADAALLIDDRITLPAQHFVENWSEELAEIMRLSTNSQIEKILLDSQSKAMSIEEVAEIISDSGIRSPGYRARRVAQTEVLRVQSYAQKEYMRQDPCVEEKEWVHTGAHKNKPRPNHQAMSGTRVAKDLPFSLIGADGATYYPMCPRDTCLPASESVNCHCIVRAIRSKEKMAMSVEDRRALRKQYMDQVDAEYRQMEERFEYDHGNDPDVSWEVYNSYFPNI